jgi:prepilin-type N-terminal cleavage/methylation domain-containing protein
VQEIWRSTVRTGQAGVTLIELLVVVTIIALFAALVGPRLFRQVGRSRITATRAQINSFQTALGVYKLDTGRFPKESSAGTAPTCRKMRRMTPGAIRIFTAFPASMAMSPTLFPTEPTANRAARAKTPTS